MAGGEFLSPKQILHSAMAAEHRVIPLRILTCKDEKIIIDRITDISRIVNLHKNERNGKDYENLPKPI